MHRILVIAMIGIVVTCCSCATRMKVVKDPKPSDRGVRFYRPKPYLFIAPADDEKPSESKGTLYKWPPAQQDTTGSEAIATDYRLESNASVKQEKPTIRPIKIELHYLPDFSEEYSINLQPGLGIGKLAIELKDGWNLEKVALETDQQVDEIIKAVGDVASVGVKGALAREQGCTAEASIDVPLGFYEAVLAYDETGHKQILGWRYVGFLPLNSCPTSACLTRDMVGCDPNTLWALVFMPDGVLRFQRISTLERTCRMSQKSNDSTAENSSPGPTLSPMAR